MTPTNQSSKTLCTQAIHERRYTRELIKRGEFGRGKDTGDRLGFSFKDDKKERIEKLQVTEDAALKKIAFDWKSDSQPSFEKVEEDRKKQSEGEKDAELRRAKVEKLQQEKKKILKKEINNNKSQKEAKVEKEVKNQYKTHYNEVSCRDCNKERVHHCKEDGQQEVKTKRGGWAPSPGGGLKGGAPGFRPSNVSTFKPIVRVCLC